MGRPRQTHCKRGHELTSDNVLMRADGTRACIACKRFRRSQPPSGLHQPWTTRDMATLAERYPTTPARQLAEEMGRSYNTLRKYAFLLGLKRQVSRQRG